MGSVLGGRLQRASTVVSVLTVAMLVLVAAACGGSGEGDVAQESRAGQATLESEPGDEAVTVAVTETALGPLLGDAAGRP